MNDQAFSEKLREARSRAGLTQQGMADITLIPKRTIQDWEGEQRTPPPYVQRFVLNELEQLSQEGNEPRTVDLNEAPEKEKKPSKVQKDVLEALLTEGVAVPNVEALRVATLHRGTDHLVLLNDETIGEYNHISKRLILYKDIIK